MPEIRKFFSYSWYLDEKETDMTSIRVYGIDKKKKNICLRIDDFTPYVYIELNPSHVNWKSYIQILADKLDEILKDMKPLKKQLIYKHKLYGAHLKPNGEKKLFPYLFCSFATKNDLKKMQYIIRKPLYILGVGKVELKMHEQDADPILQLVSCRDIPTSGWIKFAGEEVNEDEKITLCDKEYIVQSKNLRKIDTTDVVHPKIMGFDIEVNSTNPSAMPSAKKQGDKIFQISCVFTYEGSGILDNHILTLGEVDLDELEDVTVHMCETEADLLEGFTELIRTENPNLIAGYNILGFDMEYMINRAKSDYTHYCIGKFDMMGFHKYNHSEEDSIEWSSSAYKNQVFKYLIAEGRVFVDLLPIIRRDFKFNNYKLSTVSKEILKDDKADLSPKGIFKCYRIGIKKEDDGTYSKKAVKAMTICAKYCLKDSVLVINLMEKMQCWAGLSEMATTCNIPIFEVFTQGQQNKVYSQVYKYCMYNNIVVEKDVYKTKENERYVGAHVFPPIPGLYERVLPFDFCLSGDTLISMSNGTSKRIDSFDKDKLLLGFNKKTNAFENFSFINGLQKKGVRETVKVYFQDGSHIIATPEHKFMLEDGEWCEAKDLKNKYVKAGIKFPEDKVCSLEKSWCLKVDGYLLNTENNIEREKSLAFARMLGYILSDGSIYETTCNRGYTRKCVEACFGTMYDALAFKRDINLFSNIDVTIRKRDGDGNEERKRKGTTLSITVPAHLARIFHSLEDIIIGKRATQEMKLPKFILQDECPLSIIREFLGGLFGGDGAAPCLCKDKRFGAIRLKLTIIEKYLFSLNNFMREISKLINKFGIKTIIYDPIKIKYNENSIKPKDFNINPRYDIELHLISDQYSKFNDLLGFRYCINKSYKTYIAQLYENMAHNTRKQYNRIKDNCVILLENGFTFKKALNSSISELEKKEPLILKESLIKMKKKYLKKNTKIRLSNYNFPYPYDFIKNLNLLEMFKPNFNIIKTDDTNILSYNFLVSDVREHEPIEVFDIEVDNVHNFLANGITLSNCSLYPTTIIAYNIDYSTIVYDESIPDEKCHVMTWADHLACDHDDKVIECKKLTKIIENEQEKIKELMSKRDDKLYRDIKLQLNEEIKKRREDLRPTIKKRSDVKKTIPKKVMCEERYYRFLKEPKGVIPTILQNLLDARKNTRKDIKNSICKNDDCKQIAQYGLDDKPKFCEKHKGDEDVKIVENVSDVKILNNVLEKRQLAYKVSANSVRGSTPIPCRVNGEFIYKTIEELSLGDWKFINEEQEVSTPIENLEVWSDLGFTKPKYVMRHKMDEPLYRVNTHTGSVDCTGDHSLLRQNGEKVKPKDLNIDDELLHYDFPLPLDTPLEPLHRNLSNDIIDNYILQNHEEELAFIHGLFFAEGTSGQWGVLENAKTSWVIYNKDIKLLERAKNILNRVEKEEFKISNYYESARCYHLLPTKNIADIADRYRKMFYDKRNYKKFPEYIFNAPYNIRLSFFLGYYRGDGNRNLDVGIRITNKGQIGSASLYYLAKSLGYKVSVSYSGDKDADFIYRLQCFLKLRTNHTDRIKIIDRIYQKEEKYDKKEYKEYKEYVYDLETENHHFAAGVGNMIVHNSMYGIMGVRKGILPFMPGAMCLDGESQISFSHGFTRKLKNLVNTDYLWTYNNGQIVSNGNGIKYNGKKELVKITLIDGRTLRCTPDHKIMTTNGWIEAGKLLPKHNWDCINFSTNSEYSKVIVGLELPEDSIGNDEINWNLLDFTLDNFVNREKTLAFCRILGFILSDGSISEYTYKNKNLYSCVASIGTLLDAKLFTQDIKLITNFEPSITNSKRVEIKGNIFSIHIPKILIDKILMIEGIPIGKRSHQPYTLPEFLFEENCPLSVIREFLGGLFGGDGSYPSLSVAHPSFSPVKIQLTTIEKYKNDMCNTMNKLINLLAKFDIKFWCLDPLPAREREHLLPKDIKENPRWEYIVTTNSCNNLLFSQKIGFRYCSDKNNKLAVAASYQRYSDNVRKQHINLVLSTSNIFNLDNKISIKEALIKARKEMYKDEFPLHEFASLSKSSDVNNHRSRPESLKNYKLLQKFFMTAREYTKMVDCNHWFSETKYSKKVYSMDRMDTSSPCFYLDVVDVRSDGIDDVYDIIDVPNNSFFSNGIAVHNCTTYMGRTNIEKVAHTIVDKYKGKLVYGDSVTGDTPIICRINGKICLRTIDNIPHLGWKAYISREEKELSEPDNVEVWTEKGFTQVKKIIRHKTTKHMYRVLTNNGVVDVTEDHGLLNENAEKVSPIELSIGSTLLTSVLPFIEHTENGINQDIAFIMGLFYNYGECNSDFNELIWEIYDADIDLLEKCKNVLINISSSNIFHETCQISYEKDIYKLQLIGKESQPFISYWENLFYDENNNRKVPDEILWSSLEIRQAFLNGFLYHNENKNEYHCNFEVKSKIGAAGLYHIVQSLGYKISLNIKEGRDNDMTHFWCDKLSRRIKKENAVKNIKFLGKTYDYVYDLETENHHFSAGIGQLIIHNTDSNYISFPHLKSAEDSWDYAEKVAEEVSMMFPPPISLAFEEQIYWQFFILTKKRYMYKACGRDGLIENKVGKKGVITARRDSAVIIRTIYEQIITMIFEKIPYNDVLYYLIQELNKICSNFYSYENFVITKAVGDINNMKVEPYKDEKGVMKAKVGNYTVKLLPTDPKKKEEELKKKEADTDKEYYERSLPAVIQLAQKMRKRGNRVDVGTRQEYVITDIGYNGKQYEKIESIDYFKAHSSVLRINFLDYVKLLTNPIDQMINVAFHKHEDNGYIFKHDFMLNQYNFRYKIRKKVLEELKKVFEPSLTFG